MLSFFILVVASFGVGDLCLRPLKAPRDVEGLALRLLAGLAVCALVGIAVGSFRTGAAFGCVLLLALGAIVYEVFFEREAWRHALDQPIHDEDWSVFEKICGGVVVISLAFALISASAPATSWDAAVAHLALPRDYVRDGRIYAMENNAYSAYPHLAHALFTLAYFRGGELGTMWASWLFAGLSIALVYALGKRIAGRSAGLSAAAMLATSPIFIDLAGTASIDFAFISFTLAALVCLVRWEKGGQFAWLAAAAAFAGSSIGVRHTGMLVCALLAVGIVACAPRKRWASIGGFLAITFVWAFPWLLRSWLVSGNPVYPFFAEQFGSNAIPDFDVTGVATHESTRNVGIASFAKFPWDIIMKPQEFDGWMKSPGPWVLFLGIPGLFVSGRKGLAIGLYCIAGGALLFFFRQYARYFLPFFVPMLAIAGAAAMRLDTLRRPIAIVLTASFAFFLALHAGAIGFKSRVAFGGESRDDYLSRRVERYPAFKWVNENVKGAATILTQDIRTYYLDPPAYQNYLALTAFKKLPPLEQIDWLRDRNIRYWVYCEAYVTETPAFGNYGLRDMFAAWKQDTRHFVLLKRFELPRPGRDDIEVVEVYEIRYEVAPKYKEMERLRNKG
jgi:hypothetical protein